MCARACAYIDMGMGHGTWGHGMYMSLMQGQLHTAHWLNGGGAWLFSLLPPSTPPRVYRIPSISSAVRLSLPMHVAIRSLNLARLASLSSPCPSLLLAISDVFGARIRPHGAFLRVVFSNFPVTPPGFLLLVSIFFSFNEERMRHRESFLLTDG